MTGNIFRGIYQKLFRKKFFNKILITNVIVVFIVLLLFLLALSDIVTVILQEEYSDYNMQAIYALQNYIQKKIGTVNKIVGKIYDENDVYEAVFGLLDSGEDEDYLPNGEQGRLDSLDGIFGIDGDIKDIIIYKVSSQTPYLYRRNSPTASCEPDLLKKYYQLRYNFENKKFVSRHALNDAAEDKAYAYSIINNLIQPDTREVTGKVLVEFDFNALRNVYTEYSKYVKGYVMVLTDDGTVVFDSSGKYFGHKYPYFNMINESRNIAALEESSIINVLKSEKYGVFYLSVIPQSEITKSVTALKITMYMISLLCILVIFVVYYLITKIFARRVKTIIHVMNNIGENNLASRIPVKREIDEIDMIARIFNRMCDNLQTHIEKEYISEIKQKRAELKALQAQINPHFLYNTLEAIRMRLNSNGNDDAADMIYNLAEMFRISLRSEIIVALRDELEYCRIYLELFSIRYGENLRVCFDVPEHMWGYGIIKHLLQPIVENYIIHGFSWKKDKNRITIKGSMVENDICIVVEDDGNGIEPDKLSMIRNNLCKSGENTGSALGLKNVNDRIKIVYGPQYGLDINSSYGSGTEVSIRISAKSKDDLKRMVQTTE